MKYFADTLKEIRKDRRMTQQDLADRLHMSRQGYSAYERGIAEPPIETILDIARILDVHVEELVFFNDEGGAEILAAVKKLKEKANRSQKPKVEIAQTETRRFNVVPLLGRIAAGTENEIFDDVYDWIPFEPTDDGKYFALRVRGESMTPTLMDGDIIIVRSQSEVRSGEIAVVTINGNEATCKEVQVSGDGLALIGHNPSVYTPHFYSAEDVERMPVVIRGKVVSMRRDF